MARDGTSWVAIVVVALGLRLLGLDRKSVWFDEAITYADAHLPWPQLLESLRADVHPPLSYVLYHLWPGVDGGDFWLRVPAAVLGALAAGVAWAWARRIGTPLQALLTGGFVALAPLQIDLAQEARMYGLLLFLTATSLWLLDVVLLSPAVTDPSCAAPPPDEPSSAPVDAGLRHGEPKASSGAVAADRGAEQQHLTGLRAEGQAQAASGAEAGHRGAEQQHLTGLRAEGRAQAGASGAEAGHGGAEQQHLTGLRAEGRAQAGASGAEAGHGGAEQQHLTGLRAEGRAQAAAAWLAYAVVASLVLYTHYYGAFLLAAEGLVAVLAWRDPRMRRGARWILGALVLAGVSFVPWLPVLAQQAGSIHGDYWIEPPRWTTLWVTFRELAAHTPPDEPWRIPLRLAYVVQAGLLLLGAGLAVRDGRQRAALLLGVVPIGLALGVSLLIAPVFAVRYVSPVGLAFAFLLARGISALPRVAAVAAAGVAFLPLVVSLGPLYSDPGYSRADLRAAAHTVQSMRQPDEVVLHLGAFTAAPFDYYRVEPPGQVLETNERSELCQALRSHYGGWLVTAYAADDEQARSDAEAGIDDARYAAGLVREAPLRFLGVSVFHLVGDCSQMGARRLGSVDRLEND